MIKIDEHLKNWASKIIHGDECRGYLENVIQDFLFGENWYKEMQPSPVLYNITSDWYDQSIELHFAYMTDDVEVENFCRRKDLHELAEFIYNNGAGHFWINFHKNEDLNSIKTHEIHFTKNFPTARLIYFKPDSSYDELKHIDIEIH